MLPPTDVLRVFAPRFEAVGVPWMVAGGVAAILYEEPRYTKDRDVVVALTPADAERLAVSFPGDGFYCPPVDVIGEEAARPAYGHFKVLHLASDARADVCLAGRDELAHRGLSARRVLRLFEMDVPVAPPEHVSLHKLLFRKAGASERHLRDVRTMLRVLGTEIDVAALEREAAGLGVLAEWEAMRALGE